MTVGHVEGGRGQLTYYMQEMAAGMSGEVAKLAAKPKTGVRVPSALEEGVKPPEGSPPPA